MNIIWRKFYIRIEQLSQNAYIVGNNVILENPCVGQNITIRHKNKGYHILFGSEVQFELSTTHTEVKIGGFSLTKSHDGSEMVFRKGSNTLMTLSESLSVVVKISGVGVDTIFS